ncbi:acetyl-coenzyme a synthetase [hydrocarbon metagenome]|uniref:Acetyl-coenzyme a synthetase n=1 Tax=hydrocarbon metagenome TaxID=938273 RepID=A0A0W8FHQ8_9ZZZZ
MAEDFNVTLNEAQYYTPDTECKKNSWLGDYEKRYQEFLADPDAYWEAIARELDWFSEWNQVKTWNSGCDITLQKYYIG